MAENGETAVAVPVPDAERAVAALRERHDGSAARGMPAHITALYPFLAADRIDAAAVAALHELCAERPPLHVRFARTGRFPGVLYLAPEPPDELRRLTLAIAERWPECPPYGGAYAEAIPHLTVADRVDERVLDGIEPGLARALPLATRLTEACLYAFTEGRWRQRARLPFLG